jgi:hypothetical protein
MNPQTSLFHDTIYDALGADIAAAGGFKVVAHKLWPADSGGASKLRNAINPEQPHKLCADEIMQVKRLAREAGSMATVTYEAQQLGYRVEWLDPKDEADELRREVRDLLAVVTKKLDRIERADERGATIKAVR